MKKQMGLVEFAERYFDDKPNNTGLTPVHRELLAKIESNPSGRFILHTPRGGGRPALNKIIRENNAKDA